MEKLNDSCFAVIWPHSSFLTYWSRMTYICFRKLTIICSDNGLSSGRHQSIIWTNAGILLTLGKTWNSKRNSYIFTQGNVFHIVVCEMATILSRPQYHFGNKGNNTSIVVWYYICNINGGIRQVSFMLVIHQASCEAHSCSTTVLSSAFVTGQCNHSCHYLPAWGCQQPGQLRMPG